MHVEIVVAHGHRHNLVSFTPAMFRYLDELVRAN